MARRLFLFDEPDRFVAGCVGAPGSRAFYLQARKGDALLSVGLEKSQVAVLVARLDDLLDAVEADPPDREPDVALDEPVVEAFRVGALALAWDVTDSTVVIEAQPLSADDDFVELPDDEPDGPDVLRVRMRPAAARGFVRGATALLAAGRPACPFCGQPLDPQGHFCTRRNGRLS